MRARTDRTTFNIRRLTALLVSGTVLVIGACLAAVLWVLNISSSSIDATAEAGARKLLDSVLDTYQTNLSKNVADYATWDDMHNNFVFHRNPKWEQDNLGPNLTKQFGVDFVAVVSRDGEIVYSFHAADSDPLPMSAADRMTLSRLARLAAKAKLRDSGAAVSGVMPFESTVGLAAASPLVTSTQPDSGERKFVLVEIRDLRASFLAKISRDFSIKGLKIVPSSGDGLALLDAEGKDVGFSLIWTPTDDGHQLFSRVVPAILCMGMVLLTAFLALLGIWWNIVEHIRSNEARALNAQIEATRARAAAAEEMAKSKSAFIANMSHELRTPLNAIIGFSEIIATQVFGPIGVPKYSEYVDAIHDSGHHLLGIINDILLVSKVEAGKFVPNMEDFSCTEVLRDALRMMEILAGKRRISLDTSRCNCDVPVHADKQALRQILLNVMSNAVKFSPEGGTVEIESAGVNSEGALEIRIIDHGCGIPEKTLKELGKPFVQAEDVYTRNFQGTGLGLAICYRLAAAMNVSIEVTSKVNVGTTVRVVLHNVVCLPAQQVA